MSEKKEKTNDKRKKNKGLGLKRLALFLLIIILTSSVALYAFLEINPVRIFSEGITGLYNTVISKGKDELTQKTRTITTYNTNKPVHMAAASSNIAVADSDSVRIYDAEGVEKAYIPVSLNRPFIQSYKKNILISDIKGRYLAVINDGKILWQRHLEEDIVFTNISDNWILIITKSKESGYKRTVRAWTIDGQEVAYRNISNYYPVAAWHYPEFEKSTFLINGV
ncbi:MAG: hypothetical protein GX957_03555, partial [Clostridiaceae bacterium]|nr:hypothetical protein [Clostridiaceae bacterium]